MIKTVIKWIAISSSILSIGSLIYYILGQTAFFNRGIDLVVTVTIMVKWFPTLLVTVLMIIFLSNNVKDSTLINIGYLIASAFIILMSITFIKETSLDGWIRERVNADSIQVTEDGKYEYNLELVNTFQRNAKARIFIRNTETGEEERIPVDIEMNSNSSFGSQSSEHWISLSTTDESGIYRMETNRTFRPRVGWIFEIDMNLGQSVLVEILDFD